MVIPRNGFRLFLAVVAIAICFGGDQPASAGEMTPETEKLFRAVRSNDFPAVKRSLLKGGDVRAENAAGLTAIDIAIDKGYFNIAHYLLAWRKQRKPKPKIPLPLPAPPPVSAEAAPTAEPSPPEPAREAVPIAPKPAEPLPAAESAAKPAPTPIEAPPRPEPLPKTDPVTPAAAKTAEKAAENPPSAPPSEPPQPEAAATEPSNNKILAPAPAESPGILDRITGFFTADPEPEKSAPVKSRPDQEPIAPDPKPMVEESPAAPAKAVEDEPETPTEQAASPSAIADPEEEKAPDGPGVFDQIARFFTFETEAESSAPTESDKGQETKSQDQKEPITPTPPPEPETPEPLAANTPPAEPVLEEKAKPTPPPPEKPEAESGIIARIQDLLFTGSEKEAPPMSRPEETASIPTSAPVPAPIPEPTPSGSPAIKTRGVPKTTSTEPFIGTSMRLGKRRQKDAVFTCVSKPSPKRLFCIEPVNWPQEIGPSFQVHTTLYRGRKSIVRYDAEAATQFHTLFPTGNFDAIVEHFSKKFGPPTEKPVIWTVMIGKPNRKNRTVRWVGPQKAGGRNGDRGASPGILEVREIDDLRWSSPPDDRHGVVWLYRKGGLPVFRHISWSDFLLARVRQQRE